MSHFFHKDKPRERYRNPFNITKYLKPFDKSDPDEDSNFKPDYKFTVDHFNKDFEYVVVWYKEGFISPTNATNRKSNGTVTYIDVLLANLTEPQYVRKKDSKKATSYLIVRVHINHIHKLPFGSIWKNGKSKERFILNTYEVEINDNYRIHSFSKANFDMESGAKIDGKDNPTLEDINKRNNLIGELPFDSEQYFKKIDRYDKNQLINIKNKKQKFIIHPLSLFIAHYGYSMDIKRVISRLNPGTIKEELIPENEEIKEKMKMEGIEEYVVLPLKFTQRDAVFLHQLKYNDSVWTKVQNIHNKIQESKDKKTIVRIDFWHKPLTIRMQGIPIGDKILCANIIGISEPKLDPINLILQPKRNLGVDESRESKEFLKIRQYVQPDNVEDLDFTHDPVNNLTTLILLERLEKIGDLVIINKITDGIMSKPIDDNTRFINDEPVEEFGVGDEQGRGSTGLAKGLFDVKEDNQSRFDKIWKHAKEYARQYNGTAKWFTYGQGLQETDDFYVMSLSELHSSTYDLYLPQYVLVIEIKIKGEKYYIIEFGEVKLKNVKKPKRFNGIAYKADNKEEFLSKDGELVKLISRVVSLNGTLNSEFTNKYEGKLGLFKHHNSVNNNWVKNGIENL